METSAEIFSILVWKTFSILVIRLTVLKFEADAEIETKIRHDTICPLILSREFWFCLLLQIAQIGTYESIFS